MPLVDVPITVTNAQGVDTPAPFQQMIQFNPSLYSFLMSDLSNIRFTDEDYSALPAWLESYSSTSATVWVRLNDGIKAGQSRTLHMLMGPVGFDGQFWGEAPLLSPTYGQYDNGASIFLYYTNFAGTTLPTGWTSSVGPSSGSVTVNNGVTLASGTGGGGGWGTINYQFTMPSSNQLIVEIYGDTNETGRQRMYLTNTGAPPEYGGYQWDLGFDYGIFGTPEITSGNLTYFWNGSFYSPSNPSFAIRVNYIVQYILTGSTFYWNILSSSETLIASHGTTQPTTTNVLSLIDDDDSGVTQSTYYWVRFRAYPPNGAMPSVTVGSPKIYNYGYIVYPW